MRQPSKRAKTEQGFTLIELLIVIVLIAVLYTLLVSLLDANQYQKQARDARRLNDILTVQTALSSALASEGIVLTKSTGSSASNDASVYGEGWVQFADKSSRGLNELLAILPLDPLNKDQFVYSFYSDGTDFELNAVMESPKYMKHAQTDGGNDDGVYERGFNLKLE